MSNIIDSIQVSGVTYDLVGGGGITSGEVQTMIDESVSGKVNTVDNQVPAVIKTDCTTIEGTVVNNGCTFTLPGSGTYTYDDKINSVSVQWFSEDDMRFSMNAKAGTIIQVIDSANTVVDTIEVSNTYVTGITSNYFTTESIGIMDTGVKYECVEGYAFKSLNLVLQGNNYDLYACWVIACSNETIVPSYQSRYAIENYIYPKLDEIESSITQATSGKVDTSTYTAYTAATDTALAGKQTTLTAGTGIDITDNVISATGGGGVPESVFTAYTASTDSRIGEDEEVTAAALNALDEKIDSISGGGNPTVELTQAQYDAMVTAGTVSADTYYIITDAQAGDLTNYYTKSETNTLLNGKQATLVSGTNIKTINNESLLGSGNIDIQGGGKAIEAGRGISITTGETADTVSFNLPISAGTGSDSIKIGRYTVSATGSYSCAVGDSSTASGNYSYAEGRSTTASGSYSHAEGRNTTASGQYSHTEGHGTTASTNYTHAEGCYTNANNQSEHASGQFNVSSKANNTFGDSGNTLFSVGNGTSAARHNAFEIRQNGDIYLTKDGQDVKLQDQLGGGSITVDTALDSGSTNPVENRVIYNKIDEVEQVTAAGLNAVNDKFGGLKLVSLTQAEYNALATKDASTLYIIVN